MPVSLVDDAESAPTELFLVGDLVVDDVKLLHVVGRRRVHLTRVRLGRKVVHIGNGRVRRRGGRARRRGRCCGRRRVRHVRERFVQHARLQTVHARLYRVYGRIERFVRCRCVVQVEFDAAVVALFSAALVVTGRIVHRRADHQRLRLTNRIRLLVVADRCA